MPEIKLNLDDPAATVALLKEAARHAGGTGWDHRSAMHTDWLARQIELAQLPKAPVEEPTAPHLEAFAQIGRQATALVEAYAEAGRRFLVAFGAIKELQQSDFVLSPPAEAVEADEAPERVELGQRVLARRFCKQILARVTAHSGSTFTVAEIDGYTVWQDMTTADVRLAPEPTPEQVEADLAQDEQAHARYYAQPGVPVEKVREVAETLLSLADAPEYQEPKYDDVNAVWRQAAQRVAALLPEEPTS